MNLEKQFGKELAKDLRHETADKLWQARKEPANFSDLSKLDKETREKKEIDFKQEEHNELENIKKNIFGKIFKTEKYKQQEAAINKILSHGKEYNIESIRKEYDKKFDEILKNCPLSLEEREKYLSTGAMEKMNLEDYMILLKRLSGEAFYHVTRYGVRENTFTSTGGGHSVGEGAFVDSFIPLLKDEKINSSASTIQKNPDIAKNMVHKDIVQQLKKEGKSVEEITKEIVKSYKTDYFLDRTSTHFSYQNELHSQYGGEDDYKFYFYYPVEYILQNDFYHKNRTDIHIGRGMHFNINQPYNDFEIFNFGEGVPINAGILCITGDIEVDPETGSQYLIKEGKPVISENGEFKKPEKTISSKEYWENYFKLHPEIKPTKIIYSGFGGGIKSIYNKNLKPEMKEYLEDDLKKWAETKEVPDTYNEERKNEREKMENYEKEVLEKIKKIFKEVVKEYYEQE